MFTLTLDPKQHKCKFHGIVRVELNTLFLTGGEKDGGSDVVVCQVLTQC